MKRATTLTALACAALTVACGSNRTAQNNENTGANAPAATAFHDNNKDRPAPADVRGCLTGSGDRYVLTSLVHTEPTQKNATTDQPSTAAVPTTETYQLVDTATTDLAKYVGQEVRVTGEADPAKVADVRELAPAQPLQQSVGTAGATSSPPKVRIEEDTHFEYRKLRVSSVTPVGGACPANETPLR